MFPEQQKEIKSSQTESILQNTKAQDHNNTIDYVSWTPVKEFLEISVSYWYSNGL